MPPQKPRNTQIEDRTDSNNESVCGDVGLEATEKAYKEKIAELEGKLLKQSHKLSLLQYLTDIFTTGLKPKKIAGMLFELFLRELGTKASAVWIKEQSSEAFQPYFSISVPKEMIERWKLPFPNPFPDMPMLLSQPQWLEKQALPGIEPIIEAQDESQGAASKNKIEFGEKSGNKYQPQDINESAEEKPQPKNELAPYYVPFEFQSELMGFALIGLDPDHHMESERDELSTLGHIVAASVFNTHLLAELRERLDEIKNKTEELEKTNTALINADRFKREFLTMTSHELRTPLTGIMGFTKLIIDGLYEDEDEMRQMLEDSYSSGKNLLKLLNDILDMSKIESGAFQVTLEPVCLLESFSEVTIVANSLPRTAGVLLNMPDNLESMPKVLADPGSLRQVLINLISNALKFTHEGSVNVVLERGIGVINFSVIDTGIGINPDSQKRLFQKFVQADEGYSRRYGGTGLGLAICKHLLGMMNSAITLHSEGEGRGTAVMFSIPIA
ncbi:MAG: ATP-binding protein [Holophagaceae bacterium]|nr:ATP-binding protein [Holophagaceae bacterium]